MSGKAPSRSARIMQPSAIAAVLRVMWQRQDMRLEARPGLKQRHNINDLRCLSLGFSATVCCGVPRMMANLILQARVGRHGRSRVMDASTEDALKAIITGIAAAEVTGGSLIHEIANSLTLAAAVNRDVGDSVTADELTRLARWARRDA